MTTFRSDGDVGDLCFQCPTIRAFGGGTLFIGAAPYTRVMLTPDNWRGIDLILKAQPYIDDVLPYDGRRVDFDLNNFRVAMTRALRNPATRAEAIKTHIADWTLRTFNQPTSWRDEAWLTIEPNRVARVVINRAGPGRPPHAQYYNPAFPWRRVVSKYGDDAVFIGTELEYREFSDVYGDVPWHQTANLFEAARVIAGCDLFIGNQSCPHAIAEGLKKRILLEVWIGGPNCLVFREGVTHGWNNTVQLPDLPPSEPVEITPTTPPPVVMSETAKHRHLVEQYCQGNGMDLGSASEPVVPHAIACDLPLDRYKIYNRDRPDGIIQWRGSAEELPFYNETLDFVHCLTPGTPIRTRRGMIPVEAVLVGDSVQSFSGWKTVTAITSKPHNGTVVSIQTHRLPWDLSLTGNHRILIWDIGHAKFKNAEDIAVGDKLISPFESEVKDVDAFRVRDMLPVNNPDYQSVLDLQAAGLKLKAISETTGIHRSTVWQWMTNRRTPNDCFVENDGWITSSIKTVAVKSIVPVNSGLMRLIGYYVSDGCASNSNWHVAFYFGKKEKLYRDDTIELIRELFGVMPVAEAYGEKGNIFHVRYCSKILWHVFRSLGGVPRAKRIADWVMLLPPEKQEHLLGGMIAGDGSVASDATAAHYVSSSPALAMQARELMLRCGMACSLYKAANSVVFKKDNRRVDSIAYKTSVSGVHAERLGRLSGTLRDLPKFRLPRYHPTGSIVAPGVFVVDVKSALTVPYVGPVFDLTLKAESEFDKTFSASGVLVHNSSHLLEDWPIQQWPTILHEWCRVLKPGGYLIVALPDHERFRAAVRRGQGDNLGHKHESRKGELAIFLPGWKILYDDFVNDDPNEYSLLTVAQKP